MSRALLVLTALLLNALAAGPRQLYAALGLTRLAQRPAALLRDIERRLNREHRSTAERQMRGQLLVAAAVAGSLLIGWLVGALSGKGALELIILAASLPVRPSWDCASQIRKALQSGDVPAAKQALEGTAWRYH